MTARSVLGRDRAQRRPLSGCLDLTGQTFGDLRALRIVEVDPVYGARWACLCTGCGREVLRYASYLRYGAKIGRVSSCRDCRREVARARQAEFYARARVFWTAYYGEHGHCWPTASTEKLEQATREALEAEGHAPPDEESFKPDFGQIGAQWIARRDPLELLFERICATSVGPMADIDAALDRAAKVGSLAHTLGQCDTPAKALKALQKFNLSYGGSAEGAAVESRNGRWLIGAPGAWMIAEEWEQEVLERALTRGAA